MTSQETRKIVINLTGQINDIHQAYNLIIAVLSSFAPKKNLDYSHHMKILTHNTPEPASNCVRGNCD